MHEHVLIEEAPLTSFYWLLLMLRGLTVLFHTLLCLGGKKKKNQICNKYDQDIFIFLSLHKFLLNQDFRAFLYLQSILLLENQSSISAL